MSTRSILVTTHHVEPEQLAAFTELTRQYTEFVQANEPRMLAHYAYPNDNHPVGERISQALALSRIPTKIPQHPWGTNLNLASRRTQLVSNPPSRRIS